MATIVTRSGKGSPLTNSEVDSNFTNLNNAKIETNAEVRAAVEAASDSNVFTNADHTKLNAIEAGANVTDTANVVGALTAGSNITIASNGTISSTDTNTTYSVGDGGLTQKNFTTTLKTKLDGIAASANNYTHPNHSGEVTSSADGATVIADNVVDEANLKISNAPTNGYVLTAQSGNTGGLTWAEAPSGADLYAANESSPSAQPSATGANAIAIGDSATASGANSFSASFNADASGSGAISLGINSIASGSQSVALGRDAHATATDSSALSTYSRASGMQSAALAITSASTSYGSSGRYSIAIGKLAKATQTNSMAIGNTAISTTASQIALGGATDTVKISNTYTLPTSDGSANQVLTTDGSGAVTFADAGGGADLYSESYDGSATKPNAQGTNSVAIGRNATTESGNTGNGSISIGVNAYARNQFNVAIGRESEAGNSSNSGSYASAFGYNSLAWGQRSIALGKSRSAGTDSFAAAIGNNTSSYGATGIFAVAIGYESKASNQSSVAIGASSNQATGSNSTAIGRGNIASSYFATAFGSYGKATATRSLVLSNNDDGTYTEATKSYSVAIGNNAKSDIIGKLAYTNQRFAVNGDSQLGTFVLRSDTTDATAEAMTTNKGTAGTDNQVVLPNNSCYGFTGTVIAREQASATNDFAVWEIKGGAVRGSSASTTALGTYNINKISESTGATNWSIALSADTTNGAVAITVTGEASHNIRWVATVNTTEVIY